MHSQFSFSATAAGRPSDQTVVETIKPSDGLHDSGGGAIEVGILLGCTALLFGSFITRRIDARRYLTSSRCRAFNSGSTLT
jgi:hypothetical protein